MDNKACYVKEASFKGCIPHDFICMTSKKKQQYGNRKQTSGHQGSGIRTVFDCKRSARRNFGGVMNLFCVLIMMAITQIYRRVKTHTHIYTKISL